MLELLAVGKTFDGKVALHPTTLRVHNGETLALIGPSGCGKSTLLRIASGLVEPDAGEMRIAGETLHAGNLRQARLRMGYMIQEGGLFPHLSTRRNICLMAERIAWQPARIEARLTELMDLVRLPRALLDRRPGALSGGQRQRVALLRALMLDPGLLLLDEPLGALDPMIRFELQEELKAIFATLRKAVLLVTHDMAEAAHFADTIVLMREGRIVQQGNLDNLARTPSEPFVSQFLRSQRRLPGMIE